MREVQFIRGAWLELAAANYPAKVLVYSYGVEVDDFPDVIQSPVSVPYRPKPETLTNSVVWRKSA
jgi:hypothetical protein